MKTNAEIKSGLEALAASQGNQAVIGLINLLKEAVGSGQFLLKTGNGSTEGMLQLTQFQTRRQLLTELSPPHTHAQKR